MRRPVSDLIPTAVLKVQGSCLVKCLPDEFLTGFGLTKCHRDSLFCVIRHVPLSRARARARVLLFVYNIII